MRAGFATLLCSGVLAVAVGASGCTDPKGKAVPPKGEDPTPPTLTAEPPPGTYQAYVMDVTVTADSGIELQLALDQDAEPENDVWAGDVTVHLIRSTNVRVFARDSGGRVWGPYSFEYILKRFDALGGCLIEEPARLYYRADESIGLKVAYSLPAALASVELVINGQVVGKYSNPEKPLGTAEITVPPLTSEQGYDVQCLVTSHAAAPVAGNTVRVYVDATPPTGTWHNEIPWAAPTHFRMSAADAGGSGVSKAEMCDSALMYCIPMQPFGDGFLLATAFEPGSSIGFSLQTRLFDGAGNATILPTGPIAPSAIPSSAAPYVNSITITTDTSFDLYAELVSAGMGAPAEVRALDFTPLAATAVVLAPGWNELLFQLPGAPRWETFGIYHAGVRIDLPFRSAPHNWLIYASNATIPAMQARRIAQEPVTSQAFVRTWFDVPNLLFVEDRNGDNAWGDDEPLYLPAGASGRWLGRGAPVFDTLIPAPAVTSSTAQAAALSCSGCASGSSLVLQRRAAKFDPPLGKQSWIGIDFSGGTLPAHSFAAESGEHCLFFWDEDSNGVPSGNEPRAGGACSDAGFALVRAGVLAVEGEGGNIRVSGIPFGGAVTGAIAIREFFGNPVIEAPGPVITDVDGTGEMTVSVPALARWPSRLTLWSPSGETVATFAGTPSMLVTSLPVDVRDENGFWISAAIESDTPSMSDYRFFDFSVTSFVNVSFDPQYRPRMRALRDGFVSEWVYVDSGPATIPLHSQGTAARVQGFVRDSSGQPVVAAVVEWEADPYSARTKTDASGWFAIPVLGAGTLSARKDLEGPGTTKELAVIGGVLYAVDLTVPVSAEPTWPAGLVSSILPRSVDGASAATVFSNAGFVWAELPAGEWTLKALPAFERRFVTPGALPGITLAEPAWLTLYWSPALMDSDLSLRCGARLQYFAFGTSPLVDSPCWEWYADWGGHTYFVGRPDPLEGMPLAGLQTLFATISVGGVLAPNYPVKLVDRIFNRTILTTSNSGGILNMVLPHGYYAIQSMDGTPFFNEVGTAAHVILNQNSLPTMDFRHP